MTELGARLKEARLAKGYSLEDLQEITKIQKRYLIGIEEGNYSIMPGSFYVRAFIKQYAEAVGLELGADDYIVKPFSPREVVLRVKAILRRSSALTQVSSPASSKDLVVFPHLTIDHDAHRVTADGQEVNLTPKEYELLYFLAKAPDKVFDREQLLKEVWHYDFFGDLRTVDTHVKRLREKLNRVSENAAKMIVTVWGVGYKFEVVNE